MNTSGETQLAVLLAQMKPEVVPGEWVYATVPYARSATPPADAEPVVVVREAEGLTMVLERADADRLGLTYDYVSSLVSLTVHSALEAVGLTAAVAARLAEAGMSCNVVAGFHHDHLFVPYGRGEEAVELLTALASESAGPAAADASAAG
jgi:hypothetical protein